MDDIESELPILGAYSRETSDDEINQTRKKRTKLLRVSLIMGKQFEGAARDIFLLKGK